MHGIKRLVIINGSPKLSNTSCSAYLASLGEMRMKSENIGVTHINARKSITEGTCEQDYETMLTADALLFIFPLYIFCLPGILIRFLQDFYSSCVSRQSVTSITKVYAVVNCGFPEAHINEEAIHVIENFSRKIQAVFRFGVLVGGGVMIYGAKDAPFMKKTNAKLEEAFDLIAGDISDSQQSPVDNLSIEINVSRKLYLLMGNKGFHISARKNGLRKKDLYRQPYGPK